MQINYYNTNEFEPVYYTVFSNLVSSYGSNTHHIICCRRHCHTDMMIIFLTSIHRTKKMILKRFHSIPNLSQIHNKNNNNNNNIRKM